MILTSAIILDATNDFVVSCLVGTDPAEPGIMISSESDDGIEIVEHIYKVDNQWYYITDGGTTGYIFKYLIRAYVSIGGATVAIDQNGIVSIPDDFSLGENYPNPFNPTTTFNFATPKDGLVNLLYMIYLDVRYTLKTEIYLQVIIHSHGMDRII